MEKDSEPIDFDAVIAATNKNQGSKYTSLKEKQKDALTACSTGDLVAVLPTGFGKTVVIHLLPFLHPESPPSSVIVVAPLNAIIAEQKVRFGSSCLVVDDELIHDLTEGKETENVVRLKTGDFLYLLGHPEALTEVVLRRELMNNVLDKKISHVIVDEAHVVLSWGKSKFRSAFMELYCLRATLPTAKMVALTATATPKAIAEITEALHMRQPTCIKASPDRPLVYLEVKRRPPSSGGQHTVEVSYDYCTGPLLQELHETEEHFPRTIVYLPLKWCGHTHQKALGVLHDCDKHMAVQSPDEEELKSFVAQYHAPQTPEMKTLISSTMLKPDSQLRLLLATQAYGMGADCPNVRRVIHVGPPKNLEAYAQEIGRCARDQEPGRATLYYNNNDVAGANKKDEDTEDNDADKDDSSKNDKNENTEDNNKNKNKNGMTEAMRKFCTNTKTCRREMLLDYFGFELIRTNPVACCDVCSGTVETDYEQSPKCPKPNPIIVCALMDYFDLENEDIMEEKKGNCIPEIHTGLCESLAKKIASNPEKYLKDGALARAFPYLLDGYIENIVNLIK